MKAKFLSNFWLPLVLPHLRDIGKPTFIAISSTSTLDGEASVGVDHSAAVVVATVAVLAIVVGLVSIGVVLQGNLLLTLLPGCGVLLLLRNHLCWRRDRLRLDDWLHFLDVVVVLVVALWRGGRPRTLGWRHRVSFGWSRGS